MDVGGSAKFVQKWSNINGYQLIDIAIGSPAIRIAPSSGGIFLNLQDVSLSHKLTVNKVGSIFFKDVSGGATITIDRTGNFATFISFNTEAHTAIGHIGIENSLGLGLFGSGDANGMGIGTSTLNTLSLWTNNSRAVSISTAQECTFDKKITVNKVGSIFKKEVSGGSTVIIGRTADVATFITFQDESSINRAHIGINDSNGGGVFGGNPNALELGTTSTQTVAFFSNNTRAMIIATNQEITFDVGLKLPTSGGTTTLLNYYEEATENVTWTGAFGVNQSGTIRFTRIGRQVNALLSQAIANASSATTISLLANIPARFRPNIDVVFMASVRDNGVDQLGIMKFFNAGNIIFYANATYGNFTGLSAGGTSGFYATTGTYSI